MASCLPMSAITVASWLMLPLWKCCASHRSRITEVGLALDAKKLMCLHRREEGGNRNEENNETALINQVMSAYHDGQSRFLCSKCILGKPFQPVFYRAIASCISINVRFYCVSYCYILIRRVGALREKREDILTSPNCHQM